MKRTKESAVSFCLGLVLALPILGIIGSINFKLSVYLGSLALYHWAEYFYVCVFQYHTLTIDSTLLIVITILGFLLNHSIQYSIAVLFSITEYIVTEFFIHKS
jgi:hypothetical protein